jgi:hypothetical protein
VAVEAVNRFVYEKEHGERKFPYRAVPPDNLLEVCCTDKIWEPGVGAIVDKVLAKIQEMGAVAAATTDAVPTSAAQSCALLPLSSWQEHNSWDWDDDSAIEAAGLSSERVADLLYKNGVCIGLLWTSPWYFRLDADRDGRKVYTSGRARRDAVRRCKLEESYIGLGHAVVCFGFRHGGKHVLVLDNHTTTGPRRWIHVKEFRTLYTLTVE